MEWKIIFCDDHVGQIWSERHILENETRENRSIISLYKTKESHKPYYRGFDYHIEGYDILEYIYHSEHPENVEVQSRGNGRIYTNCLDTALVILEEIKRMNEESITKRMGR